MAVVPEIRISAILDPRDVVDGLRPAAKREVLEKLAERLEQNHPELDRQRVLEILLRREELRSTGIESGVAFPHGRVPGLGGLRAAFGRSRQGVDFDAFDQRPTHFFVVLLIPEEGEGVHLRALARLNRMFQDEAFRRRLMEASDEVAMYAAIQEQDQRL
jgi:PTS system nitrogen regulatory IIA component